MVKIMRIAMKTDKKSPERHRHIANRVGPLKMQMNGQDCYLAMIKIQHI